jgi:putative SOS response-associated peptidase YedK
MTARFFRRPIAWDAYCAALDFLPPPGVEPPEAAYNIAPGQPCPVIRISAPGLYEGDYAPHGWAMMLPAFWGLIPVWAGPRATFGARPFSSFTARADQVEANPAFAGAFRHGRCLVPASGFYAWADGSPFAFAMKRRPWACFAGLWTRAMIDGSEIDTFAIVTTDANLAVAGLAATMPVILAEQDYARWLDPAGRDPAALLKPSPADAIRAWPANPAVGNVRNQGPELLGE